MATKGMSLKFGTRLMNLVKLQKFFQLQLFLVLKGQYTRAKEKDESINSHSKFFLSHES